MSCLAPCPVCNRHVSSDEAACPFCSAALPDSFRCQTPASRPRGRVSRAAMLAAGVALIGGEACGAPAPAYGPAPPDAAADTSTMDGGPVALYGAAPPASEPASPENRAAPPAKNKT